MLFSLWPRTFLMFLMSRTCHKLSINLVGALKIPLQIGFPLKFLFFKLGVTDFLAEIWWFWLFVGQQSQTEHKLQNEWKLVHGATSTLLYQIQWNEFFLGTTIFWRYWRKCSWRAVKKNCFVLFYLYWYSCPCYKRYPQAAQWSIMWEAIWQLSWRSGLMLIIGH